MKFAERIEALKQYEQGLVSFTELLLALHMDAGELDAVLVAQASVVEASMDATKVADLLDARMVNEIQIPTPWQ